MAGGAGNGVPAAATVVLSPAGGDRDEKMVKVTLPDSQVRVDPLTTKTKPLQYPFVAEAVVQ